MTQADKFGNKEFQSWQAKGKIIRTSLLNFGNKKAVRFTDDLI